MERLERIVVQLVEAKRMANIGDDAHSRLALLLLDNAAETILFREASYLLAREDYRRQTVTGLESRNDLPGDLMKMRDEVLSNLTSKTKRKKIDQEFDAKADYLVSHDLLDPADARVLKRLHQYRNEAYHRDKVRQETLETAVQVYFWLICRLFSAYPLRSVSIGGSVPEGLRPFLSGGRNHPHFEFSEEVARQLLSGYGLDEERITHILSSHLLARLDEIRESLEYIVDNSLSGRAGSTSEVFHFIQIDKDLGFGWLDPEIVKAQRVKYGLQDLDRWENAARMVESTRPTILAFAKFADLEEEFEPVEKKVVEMVVSLDSAINLEIDRSLGK